MTDATEDRDDYRGDDFAKAADRAGGAGFFGEFWSYLRHSKKWWLAPIILLLLLLTGLTFAAGSGAAPFIYALF